VPAARSVDHVTLGHVDCLEARGTFGSVDALVAETAERSAGSHHVALTTERQFTVTADEVFRMPTVTLGFRALVREYDLQTNASIT